MPLIPCPDCGHQVADIAPACPRCGRPHPGRPDVVAGTMMPPPEATGAGTPKVENYLAHSILSTLICCLSPLALFPGIVAIVFASQVNSRLAVNDVPGAVQASGRARLWCWITVGVGALGFIAGLVLMGVLGAAAKP